MGVAPAGFRLDGDEADVYTPIGQNTAGFMQNRGPHPVAAIARLRPGAALVRAQTELAMIGLTRGFGVSATTRLATKSEEFQE